MRTLLFVFSILLLTLLSASPASAQSNASLNIITLNSGQVAAGSVVDVQVTVGNTGPTTSIGVNKVRVQLSIPSIATALPNIEQTGVPSTWTITANSGGAITICNGSDVIPVGAQRQVFIKIRGVTVGGPSTINANLLFSNGASCIVPGTLAGDNNADNTGTTTVVVTAVTPCTLGVTASAGTIACNGGTTTLTATPGGIAGAAEYSLNGGAFQSSNTFTVNAAGSPYTVTAREVSSPACTATSGPVAVAEPPVLAAPTINITQPTCTISTGTITVTSSTAGLTFSFDGGAYAAYPAGGYIVATGSHTLRAQSAGSCLSAIANATIDAPGSLVVPTATVVQPTCTVATGAIAITSPTTGLTFSLDGSSYGPYPASGYIVATGLHTLTAQNASGCTSPVANITVNAQPATPAAPVPGITTHPTCTISIGSVVLSGLPSGNWTINPGSITGNTATTTINDLDPGTYNFTVTNGSGCTSAPSANVVINTVPGAPAVPTFNVEQPTCTVATGAITITSPTTGLTFSLDGSAYGPYPAGGYIVAAGSSSNITAQNASSCISAVAHITINTQPPSPVMPTVNVVQPTCMVPTGTITITSSTTGLTFSLDGGAYAAYPAAGYTVAAGTHTLTAQHANGCSSPVANITINIPPGSPTATLAAAAINCFGTTTTLTVTASGGTAPLEYSFNGVDYQPTSTFPGVPAGTYSIIVKDANDCIVTTASLTITEPRAIIATASSSAGPIGCGGTTTFTVTATNGVAPLQYSLDGGAFQAANTFTVGAGSHIVTVKDANNCTASTAPVTVTLPGAIRVSATAGRISQCGGTTAVRVTATGGVPPYASGTGTFAKGPGTWTFTVTDDSGCTGTAEIMIEAPGCMNLQVRPNPAKSSISVNHSIAKAGSKMQIFEISGALVMSKAVSQDAFLTTFDISKLAGGSYMVVYLNGDERKATLFIKTN